ncbi:MAG: hypothetical protein ABIY52_11790 [Gemmatimonadaceae bacterium]
MRRILALAALVLLGACNNEIDQSTRPEQLAGTYHLVTYGGTVLPVVVRSDSVRREVLSGQLIVTTDGQWSEALSLKTSFKGNSSVDNVISAGSWSNVREIAYMSFYDKVNGYSFSGTASGGTIVLNTVGGDQLVYRR